MMESTSTNTNVTIRMDKKTKQDFEVFCDNVGINLTTAFNMFVKATLRTRELPFIVSDNNQGRKRFLKTIEDMQEESVINGTSEMTMDEIDDIIAEVRKEMRGEK